MAMICTRVLAVEIVRKHKVQKDVKLPGFDVGWGKFVRKREELNDGGTMN